MSKVEDSRVVSIDADTSRKEHRDVSMTNLAAVAEEKKDTVNNELLFLNAPIKNSKEEMNKTMLPV